MYPGEVTRVIVRFAPTDKPLASDYVELFFPFDPNGGHGYVWHCHIIDHEDNEMMRPYAVTPNPNNPKAMGKATVAERVTESNPQTFSLDQNYPNPFNPSTEIRFSIPENSHVRLVVYNSLGQEVSTLLDQTAPAGQHTVKMDASRLASGVYFYQIQAGSYTALKKMVLLK
jgi:hypothetical protein